MVPSLRRQSVRGIVLVRNLSNEGIISSHDFKQHRRDEH